MSLIDTDRSSRKYQAYKRRVIEMRNGYCSHKWTRRNTLELCDRLILMSSGEGIDDVDLRVLVRMFNRELIGRIHYEVS